MQDRWQKMSFPLPAPKGSQEGRRFPNQKPGFRNFSVSFNAHGDGELVLGCVLGLWRSAITALSCRELFEYLDRGLYCQYSVSSVLGKHGLGLCVWVLSLYLDAVPVWTAKAYAGYSESLILPIKFSKSGGVLPFQQREPKPPCSLSGWLGKGEWLGE